MSAKSRVGAGLRPARPSEARLVFSGRLRPRCTGPSRLIWKFPWKQGSRLGLLSISEMTMMGQPEHAHPHADPHICAIIIYAIHSVIPAKSSISPLPKIFSYSDHVVSAPRSIGAQVGRAQVPVTRSKTAEQKMLCPAHFETLAHVDPGAPAPLHSNGIERPRIKSLRKILAKHKSRFSEYEKSPQLGPAKGPAPPRIRRACSAQKHCKGRLPLPKFRRQRGTGWDRFHCAEAQGRTGRIPRTYREEGTDGPKPLGERLFC